MIASNEIGIYSRPIKTPILKDPDGRSSYGQRGNETTRVERWPFFRLRTAEKHGAPPMSRNCR